MEFLKRAFDLGVRNIEMEATVFAAFCWKLGIPAADVCTTLVNRLNGDQVSATKEELARYSDNAQRVALHYVMTVLKREQH